MRPVLLFVVAAMCLVAPAAGRSPDDPEVPALPRLDAPVAAARIEVHKAARRLLLYAGDRLLRSYPIGLGFDPVGDKRRRGDGATPEGEYRVCVKNPQSRYTLSLGLDYPNPADAARSRRVGLIGRSDQRRIEAAHQRGSCPPWDTALGGEIFIHGRGASADWTLGCVALDDADIEELFAATPLGTPVRILP